MFDHVSVAGGVRSFLPSGRDRKLRSVFDERDGVLQLLPTVAARRARCSRTLHTRDGVLQLLSTSAEPGLSQGPQRGDVAHLQLQLRLSSCGCSCSRPSAGHRIGPVATRAQAHRAPSSTQHSPGPHEPGRVGWGRRALVRLEASGGGCVCAARPVRLHAPATTEPAAHGRRGGQQAPHLPESDGAEAQAAIRRGLSRARGRGEVCGAGARPASIAQAGGREHAAGGGAGAAAGAGGGEGGEGRAAAPPPGGGKGRAVGRAASGP